MKPFLKKYPSKLEETSDRCEIKAFFKKVQKAETETGLFIIEPQEKLIDKALKALEKTNINFSANHLEQFEKALIDYFYKKEHLEKLPTIPEISDLMRNISYSVENLIDSIKDIQHPRIMRNFPLPDDEKSYKAVKEFFKILKPWGLAARRYPISNKQPRDTFLDELILSIAKNYKEATGEEPTAGYIDRFSNKAIGNFLNLTIVILKALKSETALFQSPGYLVKKINKILNS